MVVVAVAKQHGVDMAIPEPGQHVHAFSRDHFCIGRHLKLAHGPDGGDSLVLDNYYAISQHMTTEAVDETTAHQCKRACLSRRDYETKEKYSGKINIHGFRHATLPSASARA